MTFTMPADNEMPERLNWDSIYVSPSGSPQSHAAVDSPLCEQCHTLDLSFFDPTCLGCNGILENPNTSVAEIFAILRQWVPQIQLHIDKFVAQMLLRGANVNDKDGLTDMTLLHYATKAGAVGVGDPAKACRVLEALIELGADVQLRCRWTDMAALHYAAYFDVGPAVDLLLSRDPQGVDQPCKEFDSGTPLHIACTNICTNAAKVLLRYGANPHYPNRNGKTPIQCIPSGSLQPGSDAYNAAEQLRQELLEAEKAVPQRKSQSLNLATLQALGLGLGDEVMVAGKVGILRFCGSTEFASGQWAGIELLEPKGRNDGSVLGIKYFSCRPKHGIFAPLARVVKYDKNSILDLSSTISSSDEEPGSPESERRLKVGDSVVVSGKQGVLRYIGPTKFADGIWIGIELPCGAGKNDGSVQGIRYFSCPPRSGVFAPESKVERADMVSAEISTEQAFPVNMERSASACDTEEKCESRDRPAKIETSTGNSTGPQSTELIKGGHDSSIKPLRTDRNSPSLLKHEGAKAVMKNRLGSKLPAATDLLKRVVPAASKADGGDKVGPKIDFKLKAGMSVLVNGELAVVRYIGRVDLRDGIWLGVELRNPTGKSDGTLEGKRYFSCKANHALFVRASRATCRGINCAQLVG